MMKLLGFAKIFVVFIVCVFPISVGASFILLDNFETAELSKWRAFTTDDNPDNGWIIRGGIAIQSAVNRDEQTIGGERFLIRENVLDLRRVKFPINIRLDIFPLDYKEPNEVWFGFGFLVNSDEPQRGSVIVALRKDEQQKKSGLHIGIGGQQWLAEPNNFEFVVMKWHRLNLQLDKAEVDGGLSLRAKVWLETESEPAEWMTEARFSAEQINLHARGVLLGTKASWGKKGNPRAGFDNLIITCGETRIPDCNDGLN